MFKHLISFSVVCQVTAILLWVPSQSLAVGFGELGVHSRWNEELNLEVGLIAVVPAELGTMSIGLASPSEFSEANIAYPEYAESLEFRIHEGANATYYATITTSIPVKEAVVHLLLSATWSRGKVVREYTAWIHPPLFAGDSATPVEIPSSDSESGQEMDSGLSSSDSDVSLVLPSTVHVQPGNTLSGIVHSLHLPGPLTRFQGYTAILEANPDAFIDGNMNRLLAGAVLEIPSYDAISRVNPETALQQFLTQSEQYNQYLTDIGYFGKEEVGSGESGGQPDRGPEEEARLSVGQEISDEALSSALAGALGGSEQIEALEKQSAQAEEALLSAGAQSEEIKTELTEIQAREDRVSTLIDIESSNLAILQDLAEPEGNETENARVVMDEADPPADDTQGAEESSTEESEETGAVMEEIVAAESPEPPDAVAQTETAGMPDGSEQASETVQDEEAELVSSHEPVTDEATSPGDVAAVNVANDSTEEEPVTVSGPAPPSSIMGSLSAMFGGVGDYILKIIAGLLVLLAVLYFYRRRNLQQESNGNRRETDSSRALGQPGQTGFAGVNEGGEAGLSDVADPLSEAEVYLAYHRDEQAIQVLEEAYNANPERHDLAEKLLEIFHQHNDRVAFDALAGELRARRGTSPGLVWNRIAAMGKEISPGNAWYDEMDADPDISDQPDHQEGARTLAVDDPLFSGVDEPSTGKTGMHQKSKTALQLAKTYAQLGEKDIARGYIEEVLNEGSKKQKAKAEKLAGKWGI